MTDSNEKNPYFKKLVETDWLEQHLKNPNLRVFDCTVNVIPNPNSEQSPQIPFVYLGGLSHFNQSHIPGAGFIDIPSDLSDPRTEFPLTLSPEEQIVSAMGSYGIDDDTFVVLYSSTEPNWATRVWWILRSYGFNNVAILNGGWAKWKKEGREISNKVCTYAPSQFTARFQSDNFVDKNEVLSAISNKNVRIINALPSKIYVGTSDVVFGRKGRISGSVNIPFSSLHDSETGNYLPANQLNKKFDAVRTKEAERIITYCGAGIAASNTAFTLSLLGYNNVAVYDGSMLEWGNDTSLPMESD